MRNTLLASLFSLAVSLCAAEPQQGTLIGRTPDKKGFRATVAGKEVTFALESTTKFLDMEGKEQPILGNADFPLWSHAGLPVTVVLGQDGKVASVQFPIKLQGGPGEAPPPGAAPAGAPVADAGSLEGKPLPAFSLNGLKGGKLESAKLVGQVLVIDLWATWCGPCKMLSPILQKLHETYGAKGVTVIGASTREKGDAKQLVGDYATKNGLTYPMAIEAQTYADQLGVRGIPFVMVVDAKGTVRKVIRGFSPQVGADLEEAVKAALAAKG